MNHKEAIDITVKRYIWTCRECGNIQNEYGKLLPDLNCRACGSNYARGAITKAVEAPDPNSISKRQTGGIDYLDIDISDKLKYRNIDANDVITAEFTAGRCRIWYRE